VFKSSGTFVNDGKAGALVLSHPWNASADGRANPTHEIADRFSDVDPRDHAVSRQTSGDRVAAARISQRPERQSGVDAPRSVDVAKRFSPRDVVRSRILAFGRLACSVDFIADWKRVAVQNKCAWL